MKQSGNDLKQKGNVNAPDKDQRAKSKSALSRRSFLRGAALGGTGLLILRNSRSAFAYEANSKLNVAAIGAGGRGKDDLAGVAGLGENIVALCDVDRAARRGSYKNYPQAKPFKDFRRMFDQMDRSIDAVLVCTPDHTHAVAASAAIERGKHVYCEKPLTRTVYEARATALPGPKAQGGDANGQSRFLFRRPAPCGGTGVGWHDWRGPSGLHLVSEWESTNDPARGLSLGPGNARLGFVAWSGGVASVSPGVCSGKMAFLACFWQRHRG